MESGLAILQQQTLECSGPWPRLMASSHSQQSPLVAKFQCVCACVSVLVQNKFLLPLIIQHKKSLKDDLNPFHATATVPMAHNPEVRYTAHHGLRRSFYTFRLSKDLEPRFVKT